MYRNGRFIDMEWSEMDKIHGQRFKAIQDTLGMCYNSAERVENNSNTRTPLREIATACIEQCRDRLFLKNGEGVPDFLKSEKRTLVPETLEIKKALCDHLIVTFTYQMLCDNLEPYSVGKYCDILHNCYGSFENIANTYRVADKKEFAHKVRSKLNRLQEFIGLNGTNPENGLIPTLKGAGFAFKNDKSIENSLGKMFMKQELSQRKLPPPAAWFLLAFAKDQVNLLKLYGLENKQTFADVAEALKKATYMGALLQHEAYRYKNQHEERFSCKLPINFPVMRFFKSQYEQSAYVGIPISEEFSKRYQQIPEQIYKLSQEHSGSTGNIKITEGLQRIFNNYLMERNFHVRAMALAMNTILDEEKGELEATEKVPLELLRLHAPLIQGALLSTRNKTEWGWVVERWNHEALPVLEELFIVNVRKNYSNILEFMDAVYEWCEENDAEERMSIIRFMSFKGVQGEKEIDIEVPRRIQRDFKNKQREIIKKAISLYLFDPYYL